MSLILEALKKLDREKQTPDRGLLVVGPSAWPSLGEARPGIGAGWLLVAAFVLAGVGAATWLVQSGRQAGRSTSIVPSAGAPPAAIAARDGAGRSALDAAAPSLPSLSPASSPRKSAPAIATSRGDVASTAGGAAATTAGVATTTAGGEPEATPSRATETPPLPSAGAVGHSKGSKPAAYQLQAISARDGHAIAILNDHLVREGDSFDGVRVLRIGADEVEIEVAGHRRVVKF